MVLVLLTVATVAWAVRLVVPDVGWAATIALGAIVAPPDASAATAVLRKIRLPHRLLVILEGESLFNDATSLLVYRVAVGAAMTGAFSGWSVVPLLLLTCGGGVVLGWALARIYIRTTSRIKDIPINVLLQFVGTFAVWLLAERIGLSAIITVVAYAITLARHLAGRMNARHRIASYAVWEVAVLVLNVLAFVLIGLQLRAVVSRIHGEAWRTYALSAAAVWAMVILVRIAWTLFHATLIRWRSRRLNSRTSTPKTLPTYGSGLLASWCGMRGIVTLATALALPDGTVLFPHRDLIVFSAFCVVLSTLVLPGLTLRSLMQRLGLNHDDTVDREIGIARTETARAALRALDKVDAASQAASLLQSEYRARLRAETSPEAAGSSDQNDGSLAALQRRAVAAQRESLTELWTRQVGRLRAQLVPSLS